MQRTLWPSNPVPTLHRDRQSQQQQRHLTHLLCPSSVQSFIHSHICQNKKKDSKYSPPVMPKNNEKIDVRLLSRICPYV